MSANAPGRRPDPGKERRAILMLLAVCAAWGMSFVWNKEGQAILGARFAEAVGDPGVEAAGPALFLAVRFALATVLWIAVFPSSLRGWSARTVRAALYGGGWLSVGMLLQHYGLSRTSESLSAFLTSLTVLFTPFIVTVVFRHRLAPAMWASVACATAGVGLMTLGREASGFDLGALFGLLCAVLFTGHILVVDHFGRDEDPRKFTLGQFAVSTAVHALASGLVTIGTARGGGNAGTAAPGAIESAGSVGLGDIGYGVVEALALSADPRLLWLLTLTVVVATIFPFGAMFRFQPDTTPTRAALTYLSEPVIATGCAWIAVGRGLGPVGIAGAALILAGNAAAELLARREARAGPHPMEPPPAPSLPD